MNVIINFFWIILKRLIVSFNSLEQMPHISSFRYLTVSSLQLPRPPPCSSHIFLGSIQTP